jgi:4-hydroxy-tetrahydrodipicolinate reductase
MGRMIEAAAPGDCRIAAVIDPLVPEKQSASGAAVVPDFSALSAAALKDIDVLIEFTRGETAPSNILAAAAAGKALVCGSTGWYEKLREMSAVVEASGSALLWSPNFSLGVNLFYRIAAHAASLTDPFAEYDVAGLETHHRKKADSPSGTAKTLMERVLASMTRKTRVVWGDPAGTAEAAETVHFASLRLGAVPGTHSLYFDSPADTIEISHHARSREGFAAGALAAARWLVRGGPRRGVFTMDDVLGDILA